MAVALSMVVVSLPWGHVTMGPRCPPGHPDRL